MSAFSRLCQAWPLKFKFNWQHLLTLWQCLHRERGTDRQTDRQTDTSRHHSTDTHTETVTLLYESGDSGAWQPVTRLSTQRQPSMICETLCLTNVCIVLLQLLTVSSILHTLIWTTTGVLNPQPVQHSIVCILMFKQCVPSGNVRMILTGSDVAQWCQWN